MDQKWILNKLHQLGYTESYSETQNYKYCFLNNGDEGNNSDVLDTIIEDTNDEIDDEIKVDIELAIDGKVASEKHNDMQVVSKAEDASLTCAVTQFVEDNIDLNIVSIYGNTPLPFHGITSPETPSANDQT